MTAGALFGPPTGARVHVMGMAHAEYGPWGPNGQCEQGGLRREMRALDEIAIWKQIPAAHRCCVHGYLPRLRAPDADGTKTGGAAIANPLSGWTRFAISARPRVAVWSRGLDRLGRAAAQFGALSDLDRGQSPRLSTARRLRCMDSRGRAGERLWLDRGRPHGPGPSYPRSPCHHCGGGQRSAGVVLGPWALDPFATLLALSFVSGARPGFSRPYGLAPCRPEPAPLRARALPDPTLPDPKGPCNEPSTDGSPASSRYGDLRPCMTAFIDAHPRVPDQKENFTIIGGGVSRNPDQHVHIVETPGLNIGAGRASLPSAATPCTATAPRRGLLRPQGALAVLLGALGHRG